MLQEIKITVEQQIWDVCPNFKGAAVYAEFCNTPYCAELWAEIKRSADYCRQNLTTETIKQIPSIEATRSVYRQLGKDPSRYRPSNEGLCRRIVRGLPLYQIDTLVDLVNVISIRHGYSIGGFDADKFVGDTLTLGVGKPGEPYEGIGRGLLNIDCLPVYRDAVGGVGTPTSDNERTKMDVQTTHFLALINGYSGEKGLQEAADDMVRMLKDYADAADIEVEDYK